MSNKRFFDVLPDFHNYADQWFLSDPLDERGLTVDPREFTRGIAYTGHRPIAVPIRQAGCEVAFSFGPFDIPVVSKQVADIIRQIAPADTEFLPVDIVAARGAFEIMNVLAQPDCLDEKTSQFTTWTAADQRPEMIGRYRMISTIRLDPGRTLGHHVFRLARWSSALFVSLEVKVALERVPALGVRFQPVS